MSVPVQSPSRYPESGRDRDAWIVAQRPDHSGPRRALAVDRPSGWLVETEPDSHGQPVRILTVFLTNRECPWRCLMCDLWQHTTLEPVPVGAIPRQLDVALADPSAAGCRWLKLYNAGSFFDSGAIPPADHPAIAERCRGFERVIVECHPALVGPRLLPFRDALQATRLEVAMGLETAHPGVLAKLNKRMTTDDFARAARFLTEREIAVRAFVLVRPPFMDEATALEWACRSVDFAFECGVSVVSLIPTRAGNGALETLAATGEFAPPQLATLEAALEHGLRRRRGRVFADLWELERWAAREPLFAVRKIRLAEMNLRQTPLPPILAVAS